MPSCNLHQPVCHGLLLYVAAALQRGPLLQEAEHLDAEMQEKV